MMTSYALKIVHASLLGTDSINKKMTILSRSRSLEQFNSKQPCVSMSSVKSFSLGRFISCLVKLSSSLFSQTTGCFALLERLCQTLKWQGASWLIYINIFGMKGLDLPVSCHSSVSQSFCCEGETSCSQSTLYSCLEEVFWSLHPLCRC